MEQALLNLLNESNRQECTLLAYKAQVKMYFSITKGKKKENILGH